MTYLFATLYNNGGVGELYLRREAFVLSFRCADHQAIRIENERERPITSSPVMTKSRGPSLRHGWRWNTSWSMSSWKFRDMTRQPTASLKPTGMSEGKAPLGLAAQKSRPHAPSATMAHIACIFQTTLD